MAVPAKNFTSLDELFIPKGFGPDPEHPHYVDKNGIIHFHVLQDEPNSHACCPHCHGTDLSLHGYSMRVCQILPIAGQTAYVHIRQRRLRCQNPECQSDTFILPSVGFRIFQHRSDELNMLILTISIFCSDTAAALICQALGIQIEHDSIRRLLSHIHVEDDPDIEVIGVDDVCLKKGQTYYTVIYDGKDHHLIALLEGRDGKKLGEWLKKHPKVKMIARDRASAYAKAIEKELSDCIQVADRFHLFQNLLDRLKNIFKAELPAVIYIQNGQILDKAPEKVKVLRDCTDSEEFKALDYDNSAPVDENGNVIEFIDKSKSRKRRSQYLRQEESRKRKHELVCSFRSDYAAEKTGKRSRDKQLRLKLAEKYGICDASAAKYLKMTNKEVQNLLEITSYKKRETPANDYLNMIYKMLRDGVRPLFVCHYVLSKGYSGPMSCLTDHIQAIAANNELMTIGRYDIHTYQIPSDVITIKRNNILKYLTILDKERMAKTDIALYYEQIKEKYPIIRDCEIIWNEFHEILMGDDPDQMDTFIDHYRKQEEDQDEISAFSKETGVFTEGLKKDIAPIKNAISYDLNSGFVEGGNCRYKSTKRIMFGRAGQTHLFHKTYAISIIMRQKKNPKELLSDWLNGAKRKIWPKRKRDISYDVSISPESGVPTIFA